MYYLHAYSVQIFYRVQCKTISGVRLAEVTRNDDHCSYKLLFEESKKSLPIYEQNKRFCPSLLKRGHSNLVENL